MLDRLRRLLVHADKFRGMNDLNRQSSGLRVMSQLRAHHILLSYQKNSNVILPGGKYRALYLRLWGAVRAHGIDRDGN